MKINWFAHKMSNGILYNSPSKQPTHAIDDTLNSWFNQLFSVSFYLYINITSKMKTQEAGSSYTCLMLYVKALDI